MADMSPEDALEVEADRRRRVTGAFRLGSESSPRKPYGPSSAAQLAAGVAMAVVIILVVGVFAIAHR